MEDERRLMRINGRQKEGGDRDRRACEHGKDEELIQGRRREWEGVCRIGKV
jgi:hypothetical protein